MTYVPSYDILNQLAYNIKLLKPNAHKNNSTGKDINKYLHDLFRSL